MLACLAAQDQACSNRCILCLVGSAGWLNLYRCSELILLWQVHSTRQ